MGAGNHCSTSGGGYWPVHLPRPPGSSHHADADPPFPAVTPLLTAVARAGSRRAAGAARCGDRCAVCCHGASSLAFGLRGSWALGGGRLRVVVMFVCHQLFPLHALTACRVACERVGRDAPLPSGPRPVACYGAVPGSWATHAHRHPPTHRVAAMFPTRFVTGVWWVACMRSAAVRAWLCPPVCVCLLVGVVCS